MTFLKKSFGQAGVESFRWNYGSIPAVQRLSDHEVRLLLKRVNARLGWRAWLLNGVLLAIAGLLAGIMFTALHPLWESGDAILLLPAGSYVVIMYAIMRWYRVRWERPTVCALLNLCSACGYELTGNTSGLCPECGREIAWPADAAYATDSTEGEQTGDWSRR